MPFKKGDPKPKGSGRKAGVANRSTRLLKDAILEAAEKCGADEKGKDGLVGYLKARAADSPSAFLPLLGKVLPIQVAAGDGDGEGDGLTININYLPKPDGS